MNAVTQLDVLHLEQTIARYGIGELIRYWPATNGIENSNYFLRLSHENSEREYVLTIVEQPSHSGAAYVPLLDACFEAGLPVASVIRNSEGNPYDELAGKPVLLAPSVHKFSSSHGSSFGAETHTPPSQTSSVQRFPSSQGAVFGVPTHSPPEQVSSSVQRFWSLHGSMFGVPTQRPPAQTSSVHGFPSLQGSLFEFP